MIYEDFAKLVQRHGADVRSWPDAARTELHLHPPLELASPADIDDAARLEAALQNAMDDEHASAGLRQTLAAAVRQRAPQRRSRTRWLAQAAAVGTLAFGLGLGLGVLDARSSSADVTDKSQADLDQMGLGAYLYGRFG